MEIKYNEDIYNAIEYLKGQNNIDKIIINNDIEFDYGCLALSGIVIKIEEKLYPIAGGFDLVCGVGMYISDIKVSEQIIDTLDFSYKNPFGIKKDKYKLKNEKTCFNFIKDIYVGDIEKGNHFIEIRDFKGKLVVIIHCGMSEIMRAEFSTYFFKELRKYDANIIKTFNPYLFSVNSKSNSGKSFLSISDEANNYAKTNRKYIAKQIISRLDGRIINEIDNSHEFIKKDSQYIIHSFGSQKYKEINGKKLAVILGGREMSNYLVEKIDGENYICHGIPIDTKNNMKKYFIEEEKKNRYRLKEEIVPIVNCKRNESGEYEYKVF